MPKLAANHHQQPLHVVMVSYERDLLDPAAEAHRRLLAFTAPDVSIAALVVSGGLGRRQAATGSFTAMSFAGPGLIRACRAIWSGLREAWRHRHQGAVLVSAQDPFLAGLIGYAISRLANAPLEIQEHADYFSGYWQRESWSNRLLARIGLFLLRRAERIRAVSERVRQHLLDQGIRIQTTDIIPLSQDVQPLLARPLPAPRVEAAPFRVVVPCRFVKQKGLDTFLEALTRLQPKAKDYAVTIVGAGPLDDWLRAEVRRRGLAGIVQIKPWQAPEKVWAEADVMVICSRYEGWGRTIVEAMASGVPVIATEVGCIGPFVRPGVDAIVVPVDDADALVRGLEYARQQPGDVKNMLARARARAATFPSREELKARQLAGWRSASQLIREVGPRWDVWIGLFVLLAIVSRCLSVALFHSSLTNREWGFFTLVDHWRMGYGYSFARQLGCASAYRSPAFLFFLTLLYSLFSPTNTLAQAAVQNVFAIGILLLVYLVGARLVGKKAALIGALLMTVYPYAFYHYTQYYHTFLSSFFLLLLMWCLLQLFDSRRLFWAYWSGAAIAALAYVQGTILPATPFIVLWLYWQWRAMSPRETWFEVNRLAWRSALIMAAVSVLLIAPWTYRNWRVFHHFVPLTTDLGFGLFKANNENIYALTERGYPQEVVDVITVSSTNPGYVQYRLPPDIEARLRADHALRPSVFWTEWHPREPVGDVASCADLGPMNEVAFNRYWLDQTNKWTSAHPQESFKLHLLKLRTFWQPALFPSIKTGAPWSFAGNPIKVWLARHAVAIAASIVIFGGWLGLLWQLLRRNRRVWLAVIIIVVYSVLHTFFAGYTKYRIPLDNVLAMYAGWVIWQVFSRCRDFLRAHWPKKRI